MLTASFCLGIITGRPHPGAGAESNANPSRLLFPFKYVTIPVGKGVLDGCPS
jgi:hypothetical protein